MIGHPEVQHFMEHSAIQAFWRLFREFKVQTNRAESWMLRPHFVFMRWTKKRES
jgi:hypothetical protein